MALRTIVTGEDEILRKRSRDVTVFDARLHQLLDDMYDTMTISEGVGLAAVQVGILRRATVIDIGEGRIELINPVLLEQSTVKLSQVEGCLSFPRARGSVLRPRKVKIQAQDRDGNMFIMDGEDMLARAICHELDHLDGIVYLDVSEKMHEPDPE